MEYLLDTNICIYIIKKRPVSLLKKFESLSLGDVAISSITLAELNYGIMKSSNPKKNQEALDKFLIPRELDRIISNKPANIAMHKNNNLYI